MCQMQLVWISIYLEEDSSTYQASFDKVSLLGTYLYGGLVTQIFKGQNFSTRYSTNVYYKTIGF